MKYKIAKIILLLLLLLATGIKIHFILTEPKVSEWNYHQLKKIDHSKNNFSFVVFGDNKNSKRVFENLISKLNKEAILFAIDNGDLVLSGDKAYFKFFLDQIKDLNKPLLTVLGNHGAEGNGRRNYYNIFGPFYYSFFIGNSYFIILDDSNEKNIDKAQFEWLKGELKKSKKYRYCFVFMHVPLYDPRVGFHHALKDKECARKLNKLFDNYHITMLFLSHIHGYFTGTWSKTPYIITGGGGAKLAGSDPNHYFYHYVRVTVNKYSVNYKLIKLKKPDFDLLYKIIYYALICIYAFFSNHFLDTLLIIALAYTVMYTLG